MNLDLRAIGARNRKLASPLKPIRSFVVAYIRRRLVDRDRVRGDETNPQSESAATRHPSPRTGTACVLAPLALSLQLPIVCIVVAALAFAARAPTMSRSTH